MTEIQLYDTSRRAKRRFEPLDPSHVGMYACGPTVYDRIHIGNARMIVVFDVLYRLLKAVYPRVTYVRNITDVDDKINARAAEQGRPIAELTQETTKYFHQDVDALLNEKPDIEPRATDHIAQMISLVECLLEKDHAYVADDHVLFAIASMDDYGALSRLDRDALIDGARVEIAPYKKDPADFVLWKPSSDDLPGWDSPWGRGRPGWHLECSAMASEYLGPEFDIHGGGQDLIFPHHENEIAQSRCAGHGFARYWVHNGYVTSEGEKMSKSAGNYYLVGDLLDELPAEALRLALLKTHYRQPLDFTKAGVETARTELDGFYAALHATAGVEADDTMADDVLAALADDLNTPLAITRLYELRTALNSDPSPALKGQLLSGGLLLGLLTQDPTAWRRSGATDLDDAQIAAMIEQRKAARAAKNFAEADRIRDILGDLGIILEDDTSGDTGWRSDG